MSESRLICPLRGSETARPSGSVPSRPVTGSEMVAQSTLYDRPTFQRFYCPPHCDRSWSESGRKPFTAPIQIRRLCL